MGNKFYNKGQSLIGIIIVLIIAGLISGGLYFYLSKQIPEIPEIEVSEIAEEPELIEEVEKVVEPELVEPEEKIVPLPEEAVAEAPEEIIPEVIPPEKEPALPLEPEKPVVQKCADGTLYGQCSTSKPKYCDNGILIDKASLCGCPSGYKISDNQCIKGNCVVLREGWKDYAKAINVIVVGADDLFSGKQCKYSDKYQSFASDASDFVDEFLSTPPFNDFKNVFNFYYSPDIIKCTEPPFGFDAVGGNVACPDWKKPLDNCGIEHDLAVVFVNACLDGIQTFDRHFYDYSLAGMMSVVLFSEQSSPAALHEIGHWFGLYEEYMVGNVMGPNNFYGLNACGKRLCRIKNGYEQTVGTEIRGGTCCYQLPYFTKGWSPLYVTNEKSIMKAGSHLQKKGFSLAGEQYLREALKKISNVGVEAWLPQRAEWETFPRDAQVPTVSVEVPSSAKVNERVNITVTGNDDTAIQSLHVLNFGDATFADYSCDGTQKTCTYTFTHTYNSPKTYYVRVQAQDSFGQGSTHKDPSGILVTD